MPDTVMKTLPEIRWERRGVALTYQVTQADWDTLVRAVAHEGAPHAGVAWCLIQRFCWLHPTYETLGALASAYAQPINPRWFPDGELHKKYMRKHAQRHPKRAAREAARAAQRQQWAAQDASTIDAKYRDVVNGVFAGNVTSPASAAVHYCASYAPAGSNAQECYIAAARHANRTHMGPVVDAGVGFAQRVNWFFAAGGSHKVNMAIQFTEAPDNA